MDVSILTVDALVNWIMAGMAAVIAWLIKDKANDRRERLLLVGALHAITSAVQDMEKSLIVVSERLKL